MNILSFTPRAAAEPRPSYYRPLLRHMGRRAFFHDYTAPGYYLITATAIEGDFELKRLSCIPAVSEERLEMKEMIIPELTPLGKAVQEEIQNLPSHHPEMEVLRYVIMPDHIHFVLHVKVWLKRKLGSELAGFFGACTRLLREYVENLHYPQYPPVPVSDLRLFHPFHDQIIFNFNQLDRSIRYVEDNPRRYLYKKMHPDLFKCRLHVRLGDREYGLMGNIFLLQEIYLLPVRIHRRWSEQEFDDYEAHCIAQIEEGAVPISPAIHPRERRILNLAFLAGAPVIKLTDRPLTERTKPQGKLFDLCVEGLLLLIAPWPSREEKPGKSGYKEFHDMNDMAKEIAALPIATRLQILEILK